MITSTVGALLDGELDALELAGHALYLVGDGETVFYIGRSRDPVGRMWQHLGLTLTGGQLWSDYCLSPLGHLVKANLPEARDWRIELLTPAECEPVIHEMNPHFKHWDAAGAEQALIWHWRPCLNCTHNDNPARLPDRYRRGAA